MDDLQMERAFPKYNWVFLPRSVMINFSSHAMFLI